MPDAIEKPAPMPRPETKGADPPPEVDSLDFPVEWGVSRAMLELRARVASTAASRSSVLLVGETGTGKGVIAREIHRLSEFSAGPLIHVDCAVLSSGLIESELFGHERGAFTGALDRRRGRFEMAAEGTVFLDEIGELSPQLQAKLLRVLHDRRYERVGGTRSLRMTARIVAATNRVLEDEVERGRFRADLYFRLAVVQLRIPPLRERIEDLPFLVEAMRKKLSNELGRIVAPPTPGASAVLSAYSWPGNVRELMSALERAAIYGPQGAWDRGAAETALGVGERRIQSSVARIRSDDPRVPEVLKECAGNISRSARVLGIPRSTLRYRLARAARAGRLGIAPEQLELPLGGVGTVPGRPSTHN